MIKKEKLVIISKKLIADPENFLAAFRKNVFMYISDKEITLNDISEKSKIPFSTLNSFLYGKSQNMRIDNVVRLSKAFEISIDELTGAGTLPADTLKILSLCRDFPEDSVLKIENYILSFKK